MSSEVDQATATEPHPQAEGGGEFQIETERLGIEPRTKTVQAIQSLRLLKSSEILRSAVTTFASNYRFMFLMILSIVPLCAFMIFYEIKLQKMVESLPKLLDNSPRVVVLMSVGHSGHYSRFHPKHDDGDNFRGTFYFDLLKLSLFYLVIYPLLEIVTVVISIKSAAKTHSGETQVPLKEVFKQINLWGSFPTLLGIHLLSTLTLLGLVWAVANHHLFSYRYGFWYMYDFHSIEFYLRLLSIALHSAIFIVLFFKYMSWGAFWNTAMVISVLEEGVGIGAFGLSDYYGKHCKQTGFQLMLVFFVFNNLPRLLALSLGLCNSSFSGICVTAIVIGSLCLGNLVKWVAMVFYFYDCKQQVMEKKGDEELDKSVKKAADVC